MSRRLLLLALLACFGVSAGCASQDKAMEQRYQAGLKRFVPVELEQAGLDVLWEMNLSDLENEEFRTVTSAYVYQDAILVETGEGFLYSFDRVSGRLNWLVALPGLLQVKPTLHDLAYYAVSAGNLAVVAASGNLAMGGPFPVSLSAPLLVTNEYFYAAAAGNGLYKLDKVQALPVWPAPARTEGVILGQPIRLEDLVLFGTSAGEVIGVDFISGERRIYLSGFGPIFQGLVAGEPDEKGISTFYFASGDFYIYAFSHLGTERWRTLIAGRVSSTPVLFGNVLYLDTIGDGLWTLDKNDGSTLWNTPGPQAFLATNGAVLTATGPDKELWVLDAQSGAVRSKVDISEYKLAPRNVFGDGLRYLVTADGRITCLQPM